MSEREVWTPWHRVRHDAGPDGVRRLYCFPHAGGTASAYLDWSRSLTGGPLEVCPVELPGRATRRGEPPPEDLAATAADFVAAVFAAGHPQPFALFGHSCGAWLAYETALRLAARGLERPRALLVAGARPPGSPPLRTLHDLPDDRLAAEIVGLGGVAAEVRDHPELLELALPATRADLAMMAGYDGGRAQPLDVPLTAYGGEDDELATPDWLEGWRPFTRRAFTRRMFAGGHFFPHEQPIEFRTEAGAAACAA